MLSGRPAAFLTSTLVLGLALAGCSAAAGETQPAAEADPDIAALLPDDIAQRGTILVGNDGANPPFEYMGEDGTTFEGVDPDLARAMGELLGVEIQFVQTSFDAIIPALQAGTIDMAMNSIGDTKEREEVVDFVTYYHNGTTIVVEKGNPLDLAPDALCGARVGVIRGSLQQNTMLPARAEACEADGEKAPSEHAYANVSEIALALGSGQVDALLADIPPAVDAASKNPGLEVVGPSFKNPNPGGIALPKGSDLADALAAAMSELMDNGTYEEILAEHGLEDIAIEEPEFNGARS